MLTHKELKSRALARTDVKAEYDRLDEEFALFHEFLKARTSAGITQAEVAKRIGTTQSAWHVWNPEKESTLRRWPRCKSMHKPSVTELSFD